MIETGPWVAGHRGPSLAGRLAAVVVVWAAGAAVVLGTAAFTRIGPVVYVIDSRHGVHAFDALVAVAVVVVAVPSTVAFLWRSRYEPAQDASFAGSGVPHGWAVGDPGRPVPGGWYGPDRHRPRSPGLDAPTVAFAPAIRRPRPSWPAAPTVAFAPAIRRPRPSGPAAPTVAFAPIGLAG
ncbi:hypothetical protein [Pseudonocardia sp.]|uniref:hypothetical protein n=1 Tax=Pseudonocardia sp. TaxID=60912 RepID=UPI003D11C44D